MKINLLTQCSILDFHMALQCLCQKLGAHVKITKIRETEATLYTNMQDQLCMKDFESECLGS